MTSGIMFFIIAAVTILHLMSAKSLKQQYRLSDLYQRSLDYESIQSVLLMQIANNETTLRLPDFLDDNYSFNSSIKLDNTVDFFITNEVDGRVNSFNVEKIDTQSSNTTIDLTSLMVQNNLISGIKIQSSLPTTLVSLRSVWYPSYPSDQVTFYDIQYD